MHPLPWFQLLAGLDAKPIRGNVYSVKIRVLGESEIGPYRDLLGFVKTTDIYKLRVEVHHIVNCEHLDGTGWDKQTAPCIVLGRTMHRQYHGRFSETLPDHHGRDIADPFQITEKLKLYHDMFVDQTRWRELWTIAARTLTGSVTVPPLQDVLEIVRLGPRVARDRGRNRPMRTGGEPGRAGRRIDRLAGAREGARARGREAAVRAVAEGFLAMAGVAGLSGVVAIAFAFNRARNLGRVTEWSDMGPPFFTTMGISYLTHVEDETARLVAILAPWVAYAVAAPWALAAIGRGLRGLRPWARWAAVAVLAAACVPLLAIGVAAVQGGAPGRGGGGGGRVDARGRDRHAGGAGARAAFGPESGWRSSRPRPG